VDVVKRLLPHRSDLVESRVKQGYDAAARTLRWARMRRLGIYLLIMVVYITGDLLWAPLRSAGWLMAILVIGDWVTNIDREAHAHTSGWLAGRADAVAQVRQSSDFLDWYHTLVVHDAVHVLGLPVDVPDSPEGLEDEPQS